MVVAGVSLALRGRALGADIDKFLARRRPAAEGQTFRRRRIIIDDYPHRAGHDGRQRATPGDQVRAPASDGLQGLVMVAFAFV